MIMQSATGEPLYMGLHGEKVGVSSVSVWGGGSTRIAETVWNSHLLLGHGCTCKVGLEACLTASRYGCRCPKMRTIPTPE